MQNLVDKLSVILNEIWKFAIEKTALFLSLGAAMVSAVTISFNLIEYCYKLGYYHYVHHIPVSFLKYSSEKGLSGDIVVGISLTCFLVLYTLMGLDAYRNCKYFRWILGTFCITMCIFLMPISADLFVAFSWERLIVVLLRYAILAVLVVAMLNVVFIGYCIIPANSDKIVRKKISLKKILGKLKEPDLSEKKRQNLLFKRQIVCDTMKKLRDKENSKQNGITERSQDEKFKLGAKIILFAAMMLFIVLFSVVMLGLSDASRNKDYITVMDQNSACAEIIEVVSEKQDININALVVLYQGSDVAIISPCCVVENKITIYEEYQQVLPLEGLVLYRNTYSEVEW